MPILRLQAFLSAAGVTSRRQAEVLIQKGQVKVNGQVAVIGQKIDPQTDRVLVNGKVISNSPLEPVYFLVNKPPGVVSTTSDELNRSKVTDLVPAKFGRLYPVGRLDLDSEGLMLLTNDGDLAYRLTHPKFEIQKTYQVLVAGHPTKLALEHLKRGVKLKEGYTKPDEVKILSETEDQTWVSITIHEGRFHQVKRMLERVGYKTLRLKRVKFGPFDLSMLEGKKYLQLKEVKL